MKDRTKTQAKKKTTVAPTEEVSPPKLDAKTQEFLAEYRERLLKMRAEDEKETVNLGQQEGSVRISDYDGVELFQQEKSRIRGLLNSKFAHLKQVNIRIEEIKRGTFTGRCRRCGGQIEKEVLSDPSRTLCIKCQLEENGKRK